VDYIHEFELHTCSGVIVLQVTFEGVVGSTAFSDIAIDDVEFQENTKCTKTAETLGRTTDNDEILISGVFFFNRTNSGAPAARRAAKGSPILITGKQRKSVS